ncbi:MAG: GDP-L-fucose synthase family protein [Ignavibacteria bacterium]
MELGDKIAVFGSTGMLGSSVIRRLKALGYTNILEVSRKTGINLLNKPLVEDFFRNNKPQYVFMVAGLVGGILANNTRQADFLYQNAMMVLNVIESLKNFSPDTKLLYTGSTCIYPKENPQPINENRLLMGPLEETNKGYAIAKILGIFACELYAKQYGINAICAMPTNMYGPNDNYDLKNSHFIPALIIKLLNAKKTGQPPVFWGSGKPRREALYVDDCADVLIYLMNNYNNTKIVNVGTGFDYSIREYVSIASEIIGYKGNILWDTTKPDGMYEKRTDITYLKSIMPDFTPRPFEVGLRDVLRISFGIDKNS